MFGRGEVALDAVDADTFEASVDGLKVADGQGGKVFAQVASGSRVTEAAVAAGLFRSVSEARKTVASGGVYINNRRVEDAEQTVGGSDLLHGRFVLLRRGKKALGVVEVH